MSRNNYTLVDREISTGLVEGVDFGPDLWIIVRSPRAVLAWIFGHSWSVNGHQSYAEPHLLLLPDRTPRFIYHPTYKSFPASGRLKPDSWQIHCEAIAIAFGETPEALIEDITEAIRTRRTLLIDGGGGRLMPSRSKRGGANHDDFIRWKNDKDSGFVAIKDGGRIG